jgi:thioredoxin 1
MATVKIDSSNFQSDVLGSSEPVVVDFWAEWCGPCKMISPALEEISNEMAGQVKIAKVNVDENQDLAVQFGVRSIPMLLMFKDGQIADQMIGAAPKARLMDWIKNAVA